MSIFKPRNTLKLVFIHSLGANAHVRGDLSFEKGMLIDGSVEGSLTGTVDSSLAVGKKGRVNGGIQSGTVFVEGSVGGPIVAKRIVLAASSHVVGDLTAQCVDIQAGATFEGKVTICPPSEEKVSTGHSSANIAKERLKTDLTEAHA